MSTNDPQPNEDELRAAYEAEIKKIRVEHLLLEHVVTLVNLGMRRTGLAPGTEGERDPVQVQLAIEAIRAVLPLIEQTAPEQVGPIREALSQLQLAFVRIGGQATAGAGEPVGDQASPDPGGQPPPDPGDQPPDPGDRASQDQGDQPPPTGQPPAGPHGPGGEAGPAQRSGRLWVPGQ
jgi:hypothetical protein